MYFVPVEGEEELERVLVEDFHGRVEQSDGEEFSVRAIPHTQDIVSHLERPDVNEGEEWSAARLEEGVRRSAHA